MNRERLEASLEPAAPANIDHLFDEAEADRIEETLTYATFLSAGHLKQFSSGLKTDRWVKFCDKKLAESEAEDSAARKKQGAIDRFHDSYLQRPLT